MRSTGRVRVRVAVLGLLGVGLAAGPIPAQTMKPDGKLTLTLPRAPAVDEAIVLRLSVGVLPAKARVVVRTLDGAIAGTVSPFGVRRGQKAGTHTITVPAAAVTGNKVTLRLEVMEKGAETARPPTRDEIERAKLALVPVTRREEKPAK